MCLEFDLIGSYPSYSFSLCLHHDRYIPLTNLPYTLYTPLTPTIPILPRSAFRQSVKRAIGWRKSQKKAINKRKKENLQNSKLLTGREASEKEEDDDGEYYVDDELGETLKTHALPSCDRTVALQRNVCLYIQKVY